MNAKKIISGVLVFSLIITGLLPSNLVKAQVIDTSRLIIEGPNGPDEILEIIIENEEILSNGWITAEISIKASRLIAYDITFDAAINGDSNLEYLETITFLPLYPKNTYEMGNITFAPGSSLIIKQDKWGYSVSDKALMGVVDLASMVMHLIGATPPTHIDVDTLINFGSEVIQLLPLDLEGTPLIIGAIDKLIEDTEDGESIFVIASDLVEILSLVPGTAIAISAALVYIGVVASTAEVGAALATVELLLNSTEVAEAIGELISRPRHQETIIKYPDIASTVNVDIALIIDSSGSMAWNDPTNLRKEAAKVFVDAMKDDDQVSVVDFDSYTRIPFALDGVGENRLAIKTAIDTIDSSGGTNIGGGLLAGYNQLTSSTTDYRKAAVLLTDGVGTYGNEASLYKDKGWPVYTIALGDQTDEALLQTIADITNGKFFKLEDASQLANLYFEIAMEMTRGEIINNINSLLFPNTFWEVEQPVPSGINSVYFFVNWPGSEVSVSLITPEGTIIDPSSIDPCIFHAKGLTYELYRIDNPISGNWIVKMYGTDLPVEGEVVTLQVSVVQDDISNLPPSLSLPGDLFIQYSDLLNFQISAIDPDDLVDSLAFTVSGIPEGLTYNINGDGTVTISGIVTAEPGTYYVEVAVSDPEGLTDTANIPITVTQEDARATYTGPMLVSTPCSDCPTAIVPLRATIQDITAVLDDPDYDLYTGNITYATVDFINRNSNAILCSTPVILYNEADPTMGTAACDWTADIGTQDGYDFIVGIRVKGYFLRDSSADDAIVVVSKPSANSVTGGGYLLNQSTVGTYAGDTNLRTHFGFNLKFIGNKGRGQSIIGRATVIIRQGDHVYRIKTNALESLLVVPATGTTPARGEFFSKASIEDFTDPNNPILLDTQATLHFMMTDYEDASGTNRDLLGITMWAKNGKLLFSSNWSGTQTIQQAIEAGNLEIHQFNSLPK